MRVVGLCLLVALVAAVGQARPARAPAVLVTFEQTGGFAGLERQLAVHRTGKVVADGFAVKTHRLSAARLRTLRDALVRARFGTLRRTYESETQVADGFVYAITYAGRTVHVEEGAKLPARLQRPFSLLEGLVAS